MHGKKAYLFNVLETTDTQKYIKSLPNSYSPSHPVHIPNKATLWVHFHNVQHNILKWINYVSQYKSHFQKWNAGHLSQCIFHHVREVTLFSALGEEATAHYRLHLATHDLTMQQHMFLRLCVHSGCSPLTRSQHHDCKYTEPSLPCWPKTHEVSLHTIH